MAQNQTPIILNKEQKDLILEASQFAGLSLSSFVRSAAVKEAREVTKLKEVIPNE